LSAEPARKTTFWDPPTTPPDGAWREKRRLATALRELTALCVTTDAPEATLAYAADAVERVAERVAPYPQRTFKEGIGSCTTHEEFARFADRSTFTGQSNPIAPPMDLAMDGEVAVSRVTFGPPFEGIPGHVHGGIVAAAFDQLFGYLQVKRNTGSLTGELTVRYRRPTPLLEPLRLEARLLRVEGRRSVVAGQLFAGELLTAEAEAVFIAVDPLQMKTVIAGPAAVAPTPDARDEGDRA
jgi:acyl-coenzyme A thioesterase PaaI-like protein